MRALRPPSPMALPANQRFAIAGLELMELTTVHQAGDDFLHLERKPRVPGHDSVKLLSLPQFCDKEPMDTSYMSIKEFLVNESQVSGEKITPLELADSLEMFCLKALKETEIMNTAENTDLRYEVSDIQTWANLGLSSISRITAKPL